MEDEINLEDYLKVVLKRWKMIVAIFLTVAIIGYIFSMIQPKMYKAEVTLLIPQADSSSSLNSLAVLVGGSLPFNLGGGGMSGSYMDILKSRSLAEILAKNVDIGKYYPKIEDEKSFVGIAQGSINAKTEQGIIRISAVSKYPKLAFELANGVPVALEEFNQKSNYRTAKRTRQFIETQINKTKANLTVAENSLKKFQQINKVIEPISELAVASAVAKGLKSQIVMLEVELDSHLRNYSADHPIVMNLRNKIADMKSRINIEMNRSLQDQDSTGAFANLPAKSLKYIRLQRDLKIQEAVYTLLAQELEKAKINETREGQVFEVLDSAELPEAPFKPQPIKNALIAGVVGLVGGVFFAFMLEYFENSSLINKKNG